MSPHVSQALPEYVLGVLPVPEKERVHQHLAECVQCASELRAYREATTAIASALPATPAPSFLRARLLASAEAKGRLAQYTEALAQFLELPEGRARALLDMIDAPDAWERDPSGLSMIHLAAGPRYAAMGADAGLVKFPAGLVWPLHRHVGEEHHLILEGGIRIDQTGQELHAGSTLISPAGSEHSFVVLPDVDCVTAVILMDGIEMPPGTPMSFG
jgi:quercetin dioxygenase-like cupin family protein